MMKHVEWMAVAEKVMAQIKKGAFLTVKAGTQLNTMTIGWATIGYVWGKPVLMVVVRNSRHTYGIMEKAADFTVSVPSGDMQAALDFCGTRSGRMCDKFKECGLETVPGKKTLSPVIQIPGIHFECKIVYKSAMDPAFLDAKFMRHYPAHDYHTLYFGEICACYEMQPSAGRSDAGKRR